MAKSQDEIKELRKIRLSYTPSSFWEDCIHDTVLEELYPNCLKLLYLLMIFPISAACVERLFSKMKLVKTRLQNQLKQNTLESLLRIATESPQKGFSDQEYEHFVDELKKTNPKMKITL